MQVLIESSNISKIKSKQGNTLSDGPCNKLQQFATGQKAKKAKKTETLAMNSQARHTPPLGNPPLLGHAEGRQDASTNPS